MTLFFIYQQLANKQPALQPIDEVKIIKIACKEFKYHLIDRYGHGSLKHLNAKNYLKSVEKTQGTAKELLLQFEQNTISRKTKPQELKEPSTRLERRKRRKTEEVDERECAEIDTSNADEERLTTQKLPSKSSKRQLIQEEEGEEAAEIEIRAPIAENLEEAEKDDSDETRIKLQNSEEPEQTEKQENAFDSICVQVTSVVHNNHHFFSQNLLLERVVLLLLLQIAKNVCRL